MNRVRPTRDDNCGSRIVWLLWVFADRYFVSARAVASSLYASVFIKRRSVASKVFERWQKLFNFRGLVILVCRNHSPWVSLPVPIFVDVSNLILWLVEHKCGASPSGHEPCSCSNNDRLVYAF